MENNKLHIIEIGLTYFNKNMLQAVVCQQPILSTIPYNIFDNIIIEYG